MFWIFLSIIALISSFFVYRYPAVINTIGAGALKAGQVVSRAWRGFLQPAIIIGLVAAVLLFGLTVAAMSFSNPKLTAIILVAWVLIYIGVVKGLMISPRTASTGLAIRSGLGSLLMLLITLAIINQILASWYGGGVFAGNAGEWLIIILAIAGVFFVGFLLKNPSEPFWKLCRVVIIGIVVLYFIGWGVVNVNPVKSYVASVRVDIQNQTTKRDINTEQKSLFNRLLVREKGQITGQDQIMVFIDLPEGTFTLTVYDERSRVIGYVQHGEVVNVFLGRFASFDALQANFQSLQTVNVQTLPSVGGGIELEGYLRFRDGLSADGVPTFFFSLTAPPARQGPDSLEVTEEGSVYFWDAQAQVFVKGAGVLSKGTKVRQLPGGRRSPVSGDEFVQVISADDKGEFEGQTPVWFLRRKLESEEESKENNPGGDRPPVTSTVTISRIDGEIDPWGFPDDGKLYELEGQNVPPDGEVIGFQIQSQKEVIVEFREGSSKNSSRFIKRLKVSSGIEGGIRGGPKSAGNQLWVKILPVR